MKFATKLIRHYPPHLRHVAALPSFLQIYAADMEEKCKQMLIFWCLK